MQMGTGMISLTFESEQLAKSTKLAPAPFFRITGNFISQGPNGAVVAKFSNHFWDMQGQNFFTQYACHERTVIHFEDAIGMVWSMPTANSSPGLPRKPSSGIATAPIHTG